MNISSVGTSQMMQMNSRQSNGSGLTDTQKALIEDTLSEYDVENLSSSDAKEIVSIFEEAGIQPSAALESALSASGVDAKALGDLAGVGAAGGPGGKGGPGGPPPPPDEEEMTTIEELLESLLAAAEEEAAEEALEESSSLASSESSESSSFETILDYTNKIVRLNDDAKADVMELLNTYDSEQNTLSQEDTQKYIMNSLRDVFSDTDNFNSFSFYA